MNFIDISMVSFLLFVFGVIACAYCEDAIKQAVRDAVNVIKPLAKKEK